MSRLTASIESRQNPVTSLMLQRLESLPSLPTTREIRESSCAMRSLRSTTSLKTSATRPSEPGQATGRRTEASARLSAFNAPRMTLISSPGAGAKGCSMTCMAVLQEAGASGAGSAPERVRFLYFGDGCCEGARVDARERRGRLEGRVDKRKEADRSDRLVNRRRRVRQERINHARLPHDAVSGICFAATDRMRLRQKHSAIAYVRMQQSLRETQRGFVKFTRAAGSCAVQAMEDSRTAIVRRRTGRRRLPSPRWRSP